MTLKNILLHLDAHPACRHRVDCALDLAQRFDARVVALATTGSLVLPAGFDMAPSGELIAEWQDYLEKQARDAASGFEATAAKRGVTRIETRIARDRELSALEVGSRYTDLIVIGQQEPGSANADGPHATPGDVVLACPRPVLVVPYIGAPAGFGKHALIAWNGSREASRAVADALPLLKAAQKVTVMAINPVIDEDEHGPLPGADLAAYLAQHGVTVDVNADRTPVNDVGEELLSRAADLEADLIVMGAYGHSRAREWVFGGATRTILSGMTVPVLVSH